MFFLESVKRARLVRGIGDNAVFPVITPHKRIRNKYVNKMLIIYLCNVRFYVLISTFISYAYDVQLDT